MGVKDDLRCLIEDWTFFDYEKDVIYAAIKEIELLEHEIRQQRKQVRNLSNSPWDADATRAMK